MATMDKKSMVNSLPSTFKMAIPKGKVLGVQGRISVFRGISDYSIQARPGVYIWALKSDKDLPQPSGMVLPQYSVISFKGEEYKVIYVGKHDTSLSKRLNEHHHERVGYSSFREHLALLLGFEIKQGKEKTVTKEQEDIITNWINDNCVVFFNYCLRTDSVEKRYINEYEPPLNIEFNLEGKNSEYIGQLRQLGKE